ncbi:type 1 glutamine amidotransferase [Aureimonas leprariae]|uniref:Type 1 glutamine amidotransferase n=1 Tax=Plantimonas leprariae TaxID=2615207 RepID=A0A7V7PSV8_9HYPH|nr:type 1 glutamine amidotransferase [Aureimonas leprariae]KAB0682618.1 type 1 glutamine amidotransferase [Aureimonas leprariae]
MPPKFLIVSSETPPQRDARREAVGAASDESYAETLRRIAPGCECEHLSCIDGSAPPEAEAFRRFDAVFLAGSPIQMHEGSAEATRASAFMRQIFASGVPAFGSCAGLQIAAVAAGGTSKPHEPRMEAGFVRGIVATEAGRSHPLLAGRPVAWDAPAMHSAEIDRLPEGAVVLAGTRTTPVQALEIRQGGGVFWGVQYHPELTLAEIAASLRRNGEDLVEAGVAGDIRDVEAQAERIDALGAEPERRDLAWLLGIDEEIVDPARRTRELSNFISHFVPAGA